MFYTCMSCHGNGNNNENLSGTGKGERQEDEKRVRSLTCARLYSLPSSK